jgi:hypothetical protein
MTYYWGVTLHALITPVLISERHSPYSLAIAGKIDLNNSYTKPEEHVRHPIHYFIKFVLEMMRKKKRDLV